MQPFLAGGFVGCEGCVGYLLGGGGCLLVLFELRIWSPAMRVVCRTEAEKRAGPGET